jgi:hypothetical protein
MTQATYTRTRAAAAPNPAPREPVAAGDHPLGGSPASDESYAHVGDDPPVPPGQVPVDTVDSDEEESLTDQDEALSDGSSVGDGSEFGPTDFTKLIELAHGQCRAPTQVTARGGAKVACVCGKTVGECQRHASHRLNGRYRYPEGHYLPMDDVSRGYPGNGRVGTYYSPAQYREWEAQDREEMEQIAAGMQDETEDEEEADGSERGARVTFGPPDEEPVNGPPPQTPRAERIREDLSGLTRQGSLPQRPNRSLWYGLIDVAGARWIFNDLPKAQEYVDLKVFRFARVFEDHTDACKWKDDGTNKTPIQVDSSSDDDSIESSVSGIQPRRSKKKEKKAARKHDGKAKEERKGRSRKKHHRAPSPPSSSSSSSEDSSDSSSSDSSSQESRRRKQRSSKKKKKTNRHPRKGRKSRRQTNFLGNDPSVGNRKKVHDLPVNGKGIDKAAGPLDMRSKDSGELWNAAVDVTALPGMFMNIGSSGGGELYDEAQRTTEMAATLISTVIGKRAQIHDSLWKTLKRHAMGQVKTMEGLFKFVKCVSKSERPAFEQQENALQVFMLPRNYDEDTTNEYTQNGFLPRLTGASFRHYMSLLSMVRQLAYDHPAFWERGPAKSMLDFHSDKLLQIRQNALTRKALILQTYTYLRDANAKSFYHESMTESLWDRLATLQVSPVGAGAGGGGGGGSGGGGGGGGGGAKPRCSHCRSIKVHDLLRIRPTKQCCPLKDLASKKAREIAKKAIEAWQRDPSVPFASIIEFTKNDSSDSAQGDGD